MWLELDVIVGQFWFDIIPCEVAIENVPRDFIGDMLFLVIGSITYTGNEIENLVNIPIFSVDVLIAVCGGPRKALAIIEWDFHSLDPSLWYADQLYWEWWVSVTQFRGNSS